MKRTSPATNAAHVYIAGNELGLVKIGFAGISTNSMPSPHVPDRGQKR